MKINWKSKNQGLDVLSIDTTFKCENLDKALYTKRV